MDELLSKVKANLILEHTADDELLKGYITAAVSYAESYQHIPEGYYKENPMPPTTEQAVIMLSSHFYESRDGSTGGRRIKLTQVEFAILQLFMQNPGRALSREDILTSVWGRDYDGELKIVDVNIRRLRIKIEDNTANPTYITTVWGYGYKWGL